MFKKNFRGILGLLLVLFVAGSLATGCYDDSELRASINDLKSQLDQLKTLVSTLQNDDAVTGVTQNSDGSYTITFKKSGAVTIKNGKDGKDGNDGNDGKDGKDGSIISVTKNGNSYIFTFSDGTTVVLPRYSEIRVLTFEDADYKGAAETTSYWTGLVDEPEYGGPLLNGDTSYSWYDENNTFLYSFCLPVNYEAYTYGYASGGIAVSNYGSDMISGADFSRQLEVYTPDIDGGGREKCGHDGSNNFAVVYYAGDYYNPAAITMKDGVARVIESAWVNNICYTLNALINGNDYASPMAKNGFYKAVATGYAGGKVTGTAEFFLAKGISFVGEWSKWNLSSLGAVDSVVFSVAGSPEQYSEWGINTPAYFAIDDVAVRYYPD